MDNFPNLNIRVNHHGVRNLGNGYTLEDITYYFTFSRETRTEVTPGHWYFCFTKQEFEEAATKGGDFSDIAHKLSAMGESWNFYDLDLPCVTFGKAEVRFFRCHFPRFASKALMRYLRQRTKDMEPNSSLDIEVPLEVRKRWITKYGQGSGQVEVRATEECKARLTRDIEHDISAYKDGRRSRSMHDQFEGIVQIAKNSTYTAWQHAYLDVSNDLDGYYWVARNREGKVIMNGGLINHSKDPARPDWSTHT